MGDGKWVSENRYARTLWTDREQTLIEGSTNSFGPRYRSAAVISNVAIVVVGSWEDFAIAKKSGFRSGQTAPKAGQYQQVGPRHQRPKAHFAKG